LLALAGTNYDAVELLARVQGEGVNEALLAAAERKGAGAPTREAALTELARRGDRRATGALAAFLAAGEPVAWRQALQQAAGRLDDDALVDPLIKILRQGPEGSQAMAAELLGAMSHTRAVGPMIVALRLAQERNRQDLTEPLRRGLQDLTGQYHHSPDDWLAWWKQNAGKPLIKPKAQ
jgi:HEAT repeat protein